MPWRRSWGRVGVGVAIAVVAVAGCTALARWCTPAPVVAGDRALAAAEARLAAAPAVSLRDGPLSAGWARRCITPDHPTGLFGYGERRGALSTGVADDLFVKALVLDNGPVRLLLFSADMLLMPDAFTSGVRQEVSRLCAVAPAAVLFSATHTHGAPNPWNAWAPGLLAGGRYDGRYVRALHAAFVDAAREAVAQRGPVTVAAASVEIDPYVANRVRPDNPVDTRVRFLRFQRDDGGGCVLANVPAHGTVLSGRNLLVSADWAGWLQRHLERVPGELAMVQGGALGSIRPVPPAPAPDDFQDVLDEASRHGQAVPEPASEATRAAWHDEARACALGRAVARLIGERVGNLVPVRQALLGYDVCTWELPPSRIYLFGSRPLPAWLSTRLGISSHTAIQALRIGDVVLEGIGGELSGELMLLLAAAARSRGVELWVSSFSWDYKGYISPDAYYLGGPGGRGSYETRDMAWFGPRAGSCFTEMLRGQLLRLTPGAPAAGATPY